MYVCACEGRKDVCMSVHVKAGRGKMADGFKLGLI